VYSAFVKAGLPAPPLRMEARIGGGPDYQGYRMGEAVTLGQDGE
jgi:hypothetical protein